MEKWYVALFMRALTQMSPEIVAGLRQALSDWYRKAQQTPNPWDEIVPFLLLLPLGGPV